MYGCDTEAHNSKIILGSLQQVKSKQERIKSQANVVHLKNPQKLVGFYKLCTKVWDNNQVFKVFQSIIGADTTTGRHIHIQCNNERFGFDYLMNLSVVAVGILHLRLQDKPTEI